MDLTFLLVTFAFIIFLLIFYYLDLIRLSTPLILIYIIFCFSYIVDKELASKNTNQVKDAIIKDLAQNKSHSTTPVKRRANTNDKKAENKLDVSKPVVSFNPKPIIIDSNLIIQKDREKHIVNELSFEEKNSKLKTEVEESISDNLKLNEVMICRGVYKRNPIKPGFIFTNNVDSLFCYTKISNKGTKQEIKHLWYYENDLITSVVYNIKTSHNYRSWSKKTILPSQIGDWRVDIVDKNETILGSRKFQISSLNDAF